MIVKLLPEARLDLYEASRFYDRQKEGLGDHFIKSMFEDFERLENLAGIHEKYGNHFRILSERFPFMICYQIDDNLIRVVAVLDCRRDPQYNERRLSDT